MKLFQYDGAPSHNYLQVENYLDQMHPNTAIKRLIYLFIGQTRSPDLGLDVLL